MCDATLFHWHMAMSSCRPTRSIEIQAVEFPSTVSNTVTLVVSIRNVNDQPVLTPSARQNRVEPFTDYLPAESNNPGFNVSFLLRPEDVSLALRTVVLVWLTFSVPI